MLMPYGSHLSVGLLVTHNMVTFEDIGVLVCYMVAYALCWHAGRYVAKNVMRRGRDG